jgi:hypothetical protein
LLMASTISAIAATPRSNSTDLLAFHGHVIKEILA